LTAEHHATDCASLVRRGTHAIEVVGRRGIRARVPCGDYLDFHKGRPGERRWKGRDHWHHNGDNKHLKPGDEVSDPPEACKEEPNVSNPEPGGDGDEINDSDDVDDIKRILQEDSGLPGFPILPWPGPIPVPVPGPIWIPGFP